GRVAQGSGVASDRSEQCLSSLKGFWSSFVRSNRTAHDLELVIQIGNEPLESRIRSKNIKNRIFKPKRHMQQGPLGQVFVQMAIGCHLATKKSVSPGNIELHLPGDVVRSRALQPLQSVSHNLVRQLSGFAFPSRHLQGERQVGTRPDLPGILCEMVPTPLCNCGPIPEPDG